MPLQDSTVRALPLGEGQRDYRDDVVRGLFIRVGKTRKTFMLTIGKPRRRIAIGHYPSITLAGAREKARDLLAAERLAKEHPPALTFKDALIQFRRLHLPTMRPQTQRQCWRILSTRFRVLESRPLTALKTSELATLIDGITAPAERRNGFVWLRTFLNWCYSRGYLDHNPISRLRPPAASRPRERVLSEAELKKVWKTSYTLISGHYGAFLRALILSGQRKGQLKAFTPDMVQHDLIVFPAHVMKGARMHAIPLTPTLRELCTTYTFRGWNEDYQKQQIDRLSGVTGWTLHDLRRTTATRMAEQGTLPHVVERLLAHRSGVISGVSAVYNRASYLPEMRAAMLAFERWLVTDDTPIAFSAAL